MMEWILDGWMGGWVDDGMDDAWMNGVQYVFMFLMDIHFIAHYLFSS